MTDRPVLRQAAWVLLGILSCTYGTSQDPPLPPASCRYGGSDVLGLANCVGCTEVGCACAYSINCESGSICNQPTEDLFDATMPSNHCMRVVCTRDAECSGGNECSLRRLCESPACQHSAECGDGLVCIAGECELLPDPRVLDRCEATSRRESLKSGQTTVLAAMAFSQSRPRAGASFTWQTSSDAVTIQGSRVTAGPGLGVARVTARLGNLVCDGVVEVESLGDPAQLRVTVQTPGRAPIKAATVALASTASTTTDENGHAELPLVNGATLLVAADSRAQVAVRGVDTADLLVRLPALPSARTQRFWGSVDLSAARRADVSVAWVGTMLEQELSETALTDSLGDAELVRINAPELGLDNESVNLQTGLSLSLGSKKFTELPSRCGSEHFPGSSEVGCYRLSTEPGARGLWAIGAKLNLSALTPSLGRLSSSFAEHGLGHEIQGIQEAGMIQHIYHQFFEGVDLWASPGEYRSLELNQKARVLSRMRLPTLPHSDGPMSFVIAVVAARTPQGIVPIALSGGTDGMDEAPKDQALDASSEQPFGPTSDELDPSILPLSLPALSGGLEDRPREVLVSVYDPTDLPRGRLRFSSISEDLPDHLGEDHSLWNGFLPFLDGQLDPARAAFQPLDVPAGGYFKFELRVPEGRWIAYAPNADLISLEGLIPVSAALDPRASLSATYYEAPLETAFRIGTDYVRPARFTTLVWCGPEAGCLFR